MKSIRVFTYIRQWFVAAAVCCVIFSNRISLSLVATCGNIL